MPLVYDGRRWIEWNGPLGDEPGGWVQERARRQQAEADRLHREQGRWRVADRIATAIALGVLGTGAGSAIAGAGSGTGTSAGSATGSLPPIAGGPPWAVTPYAGTAAMSPTGAAAVGGTVGAGAGAAGAGMGGGVGGGVGGSLAGLSARDLAGLTLAGVGTIGGAMSDQPDFSPNTMTSDPNLQRLMQTMQGRLDKSEPLYDSIMAMANGLLPTQYQKGGGGMR